MKANNSNKILIIVGHPDDAEISMGMKIRKHVLLEDEVKIVVLSKGGSQGNELKNIRVKECISAGKELGLNKDNYVFFDIEDTYFSSNKNKIRNILESVVKEYKPNVLYTHYPKDYHFDHQVTSKEAIVACRSVPKIYYFRSPYTKNFNPNKFLFETEEFYEHKNEALKKFKSQSLIDTKMIKKLSSIEYAGLLHPTLLFELFKKYGTKNLYYEPFSVLREIE